MALESNPAVTRHHGLLGTVVEVRTWADDVVAAHAADAAVVAEIERLQGVFSRFDPSSGLRRWRDGAPPSPELAEVLELAADWRARSGGAFDPTVGRLVAVWDDAAAHGRTPADEQLVLAARAVPLELGLDAPAARPWVDLNGIAKGWITDRASAVGRSVPGVVGMTVNAGGDLAHHHGGHPLVVGIEDPARPFDNVPPLLRIRLVDGAVATSGGSRRGWTIGGRRYSHVLDPRTGRPADRVASASVLAPDVATADVVATVLTVLAPTEGVAFVEDLADVGCCLVTAAGEVVRGGTWSAVELSGS